MAIERHLSEIRMEIDVHMPTPSNMRKIITYNNCNLSIHVEVLGKRLKGSRPPHHLILNTGRFIVSRRASPKSAGRRWRDVGDGGRRPPDADGGRRMP